MVVDMGLPGLIIQIHDRVSVKFRWFAKDHLVEPNMGTSNICVILLE